MTPMGLTHDDYLVAWICPLEVEQVAALCMLDNRHKRLPQPKGDHNAYNLGDINGHNVVVAGLHTAGNCSAATVVTQMRSTFPRLRFGLLVGIGGGVPVATDAGPIRLGHIVVSKPAGEHSGAVQYDHGKAAVDGFQRTGSIAPPPTVLLNAARELYVHRLLSSDDPLLGHLDRIDTSKHDLRKYRRPGPDQDQLYQPDYPHPDHRKSCKRCGCETSKLVDREEDDSSDDDSVDGEDLDRLVIHRGTIASGEMVIKDGRKRDALAREHGILCFEMEAAGTMNDFPCLVVRGISDYCDSHKNDKWHGYAAAVAAAYARELFSHMPVEEVEHCKIAEAGVKISIAVVKKLAEDAAELVDHSIDSQIKRWLNPADPSIDLNNATVLRHQDTGSWFLNSQRYAGFRATVDSRLWLRGIPGCGKTVLASTIINDLRLQSESPKPTVIYFFITFRDAMKQELKHVLHSLIFQLYTRHHSTRHHLTRLFKRFHGTEQPHTQDLMSTLECMIKELHDVTIVLDALDESKETKRLLEWIITLECRVVLTSRSEREIEDKLISWLLPDCIVTLQGESVSDDIQAYVHHRITDTANLKDMISVHDDVINDLTLRDLPDDLNETYDRIMMSIPKQCESEAIRLLQFVVFAYRPLRLSELVDAVATEPDDAKPFDEENRFTPSEVLLECCPGLLRVTYGDEYDITFHDGSGFECDNDERYVQLAHFSVQEYLLSDRKQNLYKQHFRAVAANAKIAQICLSYLWSNMDFHQNLEGMSIEYPFTRYATWLWERHVSIAGDSEDCTFSWILKATTDRRFLSYFMEKRTLAVYPESEEQLEYMMYLICKCGLTRSVESLLDNGFDPSTVCYGYGETALYGASVHGHVETVRALLDHGANVDAQNLMGKTALDAAASKGHLQVVELLVTHTLRVNVSKGYYESALEAAAHHGHLRVVEYLLDKVDYKNIKMNRSRTGADVGQTDDLCAACAAGRVERVRTLLEDDGAGVMSSKTKEDALRLARHHRQPEIIQMLNNYSGIGYGFDRDNLFGTALAAAAYGGHTDIVRLLLKTNLDIDDAQWYQHAGPGEAFHGTPLQAASRRGHLETVRVLLECGAQVNAKTGSHGYALHGALAKGHKDVSLLLLKYGADIRAIGGKYDTALHAAALGGDLEIVKMCLDSGMDVDMLNKEHETVLCTAA
ncbi:Pfs, NACHT and ankyrin domain protein [Aureobasidium subglaciale]|nr:Pfs, NACHT and ankyrin domain protein [Aureobasidium subglaciale]